MSQDTFKYLVTGLAVTGFGMFLWAWSEFKRRQFRKFVDGKIRGVFLMRSSGKFKTAVCEIEGNGKTAHVRYPKTGEGNGDPVYYLGQVEKTGFDSIYPLGGFMERLGSPIKAIVFLEGNEKPVMEIISPSTQDWDSNKKLGILLDEKSGEISMEATAEISRLEDQLKKSLNPLYLYIGMGIIAALVGVGLYYQINMQDAVQIMASIKIALGL